MGSVINSVFGGKSQAEKDLSKVSRSPYEGYVQRYLPPQLRAPTTGPIIGAGITGIGQLIQHPGTLSPTVEDAIRQQLAAESENIGQNYRGLASNQAGAAARGNLPISIRTALESALGVAQERAQRGARRDALNQSDTLRRQDLSQTYQLLDAILQFMSSGRGQAIQGLGASTAADASRQAANMGAIGSVISSFAAPGS